MKTTTTARAGAVLLLLAMALDAAAQAQGIYRCGPHGRQLQQHPCGTSADPAPTASPNKAPDEQAARRNVRELQEKADRMERERLAQEARDRRATARAAGINSRPHPPRAAPDTASSPRKTRVRPLGAAQPVPRHQAP